MFVSSRSVFRLSRPKGKLFVELLSVEILDDEKQEISLKKARRQDGF